MTTKLLIRAMTKFISSVVLVGALIFLPAGTFFFVNGWIFMAYPFIIAKRIKHEEAFLEKELDGYREYKQKVRYRLLPFIW